jgi:hypothetical protein
MRRVTTLVLLTAALVGLLAGTAEAGSGVGQTDLSRSDYVAFEVRADNGLAALVEVSGHRVSLRVGTHSQLNDYQVRGAVSGNTVRARFGKLGHLAVHFRPTKTLPVERPGRGCGGVGAQNDAGITQQTELGVFAGHFHFTGERGYVHVDASRARGEVINPIHFDCSDPPPTIRHSSHRTLSETGPGIDQLDRESESGHVAVLRAESPSRAFIAIAVGHPEKKAAAYFFAGARERLGPVRIFRIAAAKAPFSTFAFDHKAGTATLTPPAPFTGSGAFQRNADGSASWTGTLSAPLLGIDPVTLAGPGFEPVLAPDFPD